MALHLAVDPESLALPVGDRHRLLRVVGHEGLAKDRARVEREASVDVEGARVGDAGDQAADSLAAMAQANSAPQQILSLLKG